MIFVFLWLNSLSMTISRSIHVAANGMISFFFMAEESSIVYMCHIFFIHPSLDGHLGFECWHFLAGSQWIPPTFSCTGSTTSWRPLIILSGLLEAYRLIDYLSLWAVFSLWKKKKPKENIFIFLSLFILLYLLNKNDCLSMYFLELLKHDPAITRAAHFVQSTAHIL